MKHYNKEGDIHMTKKVKTKKEGFKKPAGATNYTSVSDRITPFSPKTDDDLTKVHP